MARRTEFEAMRTVLWVFGWIGVAVWTIFALVGFGVLGFVGDLARDFGGHVPGFPDEVFSAPWLAELTQSIGRFALFLVWAIGTAVILAVPAVVGLFLPRRELTRSYQGDARAARFPAPGRPSGPVAPFGRPPLAQRRPSR
jgi:hypothetical protein